MLISVIIPCRNEEANISECINAIYASELNVGYSIEVLLVDGVSDDGTVGLVQELQVKYPTLRLIENIKQVTPVAFNMGIRAAKGGFLQIIGARQVISNNYLQGCIDVLEKNEDIWCVGGGVENVYQTAESEIIGLAMSSAFGVGAGNFRVAKKSEYTDTVGTPMYKTEVFEQIGLFNEDLVRNQDDELNYRVTLNGGNIYLNADVSIKYYVRASIPKLFKQYMQYGYWKVYVNKLHGTVTSIRQLVPLFFVLGIILGLILSMFSLFIAGAFICGLILYVCLAIYFGLKSSNGVLKGIRVARVFPVLHWSYGYGYLKGLVHFFILQKKPTSKSKSLSRD